MTLALDFMVWLHVQLLTVLDSMSLAVGGYNVSFLEVIFGFLVIFMVIAVFWKGARG